MKKLGLLFLLTLVTATVASCGGSSSSQESLVDDNSNVTQTAMGEVNNLASTSEGSAVYRAACTYGGTVGACTANANTLTWGSCTINAGAATMTGSWTQTFTGGNGNCQVPLAANESVVRTTTGSTLTLNIVFPGAKVTTDTNGDTAWDATVIPNAGNSSAMNGAATTRTIHINEHRQMHGPFGREWFDHDISTDVTSGASTGNLTSTPITLTGTLAGGTRTITGGQILVFHNLAKYVAQVSFAGVTWGTAGCCYPTAGTVTTLLKNVNGTIGTTSLVFSATCGQATFTDVDGSSSTLTMRYCH